ncbi:pyruvate kinase [Parvularcula oceani]|uniref:pyruvate kinase n=1 Tax=Parvularcula oceani TaxID=1247963 RepID=UPI0004E25531|nr:pyruvate kinase [Parvularcula oceani]
MTVRPTTKILATMGPASDSPHRIQALISAGATAFRMNFSHGSHEEHAVRFEAVRKVAAEMGRHVPIVSDLQGPKLRVGRLAGGEIALGYGEEVEARLGAEAPEGIIPIPHKELFDALQDGDALMLDDGTLRLSVVKAEAERLTLKVEVPGRLTDKKGINVPGRRLPIAALTEKDEADLAFALEQNTDYVALSFVQTAEDVERAKALIDGRAKVIAKIEKPQAVEEIEAIADAADALMVARGDLGVELPLEQVPLAQRRIVRAARARGKPVIVATQMLQSMVDAPTPTRAEASDTAAAVFLGADAVMLSAESAVGRHPEAAVAIMTRIIRAAASGEDYQAEMERIAEEQRADSPGAAVAVSAAFAAKAIECRAIVASTNTGGTAYTIARLRPAIPIIALTPDPKTARQTALAWGTLPVLTHEQENFEQLSGAAVASAREALSLSDDDRIVLLAGIPTGRTGGTNTLKVIRVGDGS